MDYAGNRPAAALDMSEPRAKRLQAAPPQPHPAPSAAARIVTIDDTDRDTEPSRSPGSSATEQRLEAFIGINCETYLDYYRTVFRTGNKNLLSHWHWVPFVFSTVWLFARRRYVAAAVLASVPIIANQVFPGGPALAIAFASVAICCGFAGRPLYMALSLRKIAEVESRRLWPVQRDEKLHRSGGVSVMGAVCGSVLWAATAAIPFLQNI